MNPVNELIRLFDYCRTYGPGLGRVYLFLLLSILYCLAALASTVGFLVPYIGAIYLIGGAPILDSLVCLIACPLVIGLAFNRFQAAILMEAELIREVGHNDALWFDRSSTSLLGLGTKHLTRRVVMEGFAVQMPQISTLAATFGYYEVDTENVPEQVLWNFASSTWSSFILWCETALLSTNFPKFVAPFSIFVVWAYFTKKLVTLHLKLFWAYVWAIGIIFCLPNATIVNLVRVLRSLMTQSPINPMPDGGGEGSFWEWLKWRVTGLCVDFTVQALDLHLIGVKFTSKKAFSSESTHRSWQSHMNQLTMQLAIIVSDMGLPHYVRRGFRTLPTVESLQESKDLLASLGWPVNVTLTDPDMSEPSVRKWREWVIGGTDWQQGIRAVRTHTDHQLDKLRIHALEYRRAESYATIKNEIEATSRYFHSPRYDYPDLPLDDVWFMVGDVFRRSRLTPFNYIIAMWEKRYGLGAFMADPLRRRAKYKRSLFIRDIGGMKPFKALWRRTFEFAPLIFPVSAVSVKGEALPEKKWARDKVRTVIGSPISQYILSTIWNYAPNHNFKWETTPMKPGMPLNGYHMADVFANHSRCQHHLEGDMSEFDSTVSGKVQHLISAVRKKGFEFHKDKERICELIDLNYIYVRNQALNTTSNGNIYRKGEGLTTGHSSTTSDNSLALVILYLMAWRDVTGLSAREFKHFNELSCYGDDHVLSYLATKPPSWNMRNIQKAMARWGVTNNMVSKPLHEIEFLSKFSRKPTRQDMREFQSLGLPLPRQIVYHNKQKLVGKMVAPLTNFDPLYRARRLISYLSLTAHHPDVYEEISSILARSSTLKRALRGRPTPIPTYKQVVSSWYDNKGGEVKINDEFSEMIGDKDTKLNAPIHYGTVTLGDAFLGTLAMVPDLLNPVIFNFGYMKAMQTKLKRFLNWPVHLLVAQNRILSEAEARVAIRRTAYDALDPTVHGVGLGTENMTTLLIRHWLFCWYKWSLATRRPAITLLMTIARKVGSIQFALNGHMQVEQANLNLGLFDLAVIVALNIVTVPDFLPILGQFRLPDVNLWYEAIYQFLLVTIWARIPPNYKDITHSVRHLRELGGPLCVTAPTGTGKSTAMINHLRLSTGHQWNRIIVIEPRSLLVHSLTKYMKDSFALDCSGATTGLSLDREAKVWYMTPQSFAMTAGAASDQNLVVLDEAHLIEPSYQLLVAFLAKAGIPTIFVTATPTKLISDASALTIDMDTAKLWAVDTQTVWNRNVTNVKDAENAYINWAIGLISNQWTNAKTLLFIPSVTTARKVAERIPKKVFLLHSKGEAPKLGDEWDVIISTSVADAGLTLPNVDTVVTWDHDISVVSNEDSVQVSRYRLSEQALRQRAGRTGRTNNGTAYFYRTPEVSSSSDPGGAFGSPEQVYSWIESGFSPHLIDYVSPKFIGQLFNEGTHAGGSDPFTSNQAELLSIFIDNMRPLVVSRLAKEKPLLGDGSDPIMFDYTAAGIVSESSQSSVSTMVRSVIKTAKFLSANSSPEQIDLQAFEDCAEPLLRASGLEMPYLAVIKSLFPGWGKWADQASGGDYLPPLSKKLGVKPQWTHQSP